MPLCPKNPNRYLSKGHKNIAFEPKMDGEKWFQLVLTIFTVKPSRKALVWAQAPA